MLFRSEQDLDSKFKFIRISLDAASAETYKKIKKTDYFGMVVHNVVELVKRGNCETVGLSFVVCDDNRHEIQEAINLSNRIGMAYCQIKPVISYEGIETALSGVEENEGSIITPRYDVDKKSYVACAIAGLIGSVGADGKVYYCCIHRGNEKFEIGDLHKEPFEDICYNRVNFKPDLSGCATCRYMNYAKGYKEFSQKKYSFLRHKNFL